MIAIVRKNLASFCSTQKSTISSSLSQHFFSTQGVTCPRVYDLLLHKYQFSAEIASLAASDLALQKCPENVDSIMSFLKESGCSSTQLEKIVKYKPRILLHRVDDIKLKISIFQDLGLSPEDTAKMISNNQAILHLGAKSNIIPSLLMLKGLLGSDYHVARLLKKTAWPLHSDLGNTLLPNVEFLKSVGVPMEHILFVLNLYPRSFLNNLDTTRKSVEIAKEMGLNECSKMFLYVFRIVASMSKRTWELKLQSFQEMGFSESDSLTMLKKYPPVFTASMKKIEKVKQLLLATGKFDMRSIVNNPRVFGCSIELILEPRLRVLEILERNNLIKKWPSLGTICTLSYDKFSKRFMRPYFNEVSEAFVTKSCVKGKS